jgi:Uma2 family endonuclease
MISTSPTLNLSQRVILPGHSWSQFKQLQRAIDQTSKARLYYYQEKIEIFMPGKDHEAFKSLIGQLIELFFLKRGIVYKATGSMTQEQDGVVSLQADESYCIGADKPIPDLSIEVTYTSGHEGKLSRYLALAVPEVWFWEDGVLKVYHLRNGEYDRVSHSQLPGLESLDIDRLSRCILKGEISHLEAAQDWFSTI